MQCFWTPDLHQSTHGSGCVLRVLMQQRMRRVNTAVPLGFIALTSVCGAVGWGVIRFLRVRVLDSSAPSFYLPTQINLGGIKKAYKFFECHFC